MSDEDGLASPLDNDLPYMSSSPRARGMLATYVLALGNGSEIDLNLGLGQDIGGSGHVDEEIYEAKSLARVASITAHLQPIRKTANGFPAAFGGCHLPIPLLSEAPGWCGVNLPCTVAFAPKLVSAPMVPTMKYDRSLGPFSSPPVFL